VVLGAACGRTELYPRAAGGVDAGSAVDASDGTDLANDNAGADAGDMGPPEPSSVLQLVLGNGESCARLSDGTVKCWGDLSYDLPLLDTATCAGATPHAVPELAGAIALGQIENSHSCAVFAGGAVRCWGANHQGQLGDGTTIDRTSPVAVAGLSDVTQISVGAESSCAVLAAGTVRCWGAGYGVLPADVPNLRGALRLSSSYKRTCAVIDDGSVQCWSDGLAPAPVPWLAGVRQIAVGFLHSCALLDDGTVRCWGVNSDGQLGDGTTTGTQQPVVASGVFDATEVAVGFSHTCALRRDGSIVCWGVDFASRLGDGSYSDSLVAAPVPLARPALELAAGTNHSCARLDDGSVWCWGSDYSGELGDGHSARICAPLPVVGLSGAYALIAGDRMSCALTRGQVLDCWGLVIAAPDWQIAPHAVVLPATPQTMDVAIGYDHACVLRADETVACWGSDQFGQLGDGNQGDAVHSAAPVIARGLSGAQGIAIGDGYTCARLADGSAACWGINQWGQLGDGTNTDHSLPAAVAGLMGVAALDAGAGHACALLRDGTVSCWGANASGQLGDGTTVSRPTPALVPGLAGVVEISAGGSHTCARLADHTAVCWGNDQRGQLGVAAPPNGFGILSPTMVPGLTNVAQIAAGGEHTCARLDDGTVTCWGANDNSGQLGDGTHVDRATPAAVPGLSGVAALALGQNHSCALLVDGTARCWGYNADGQVGVGWDFVQAIPVRVQGLP
jgi:alpha-tubulin suppressor-like RCC1 family protein